LLVTSNVFTATLELAKIVKLMITAIVPIIFLIFSSRLIYTKNLYIMKIEKVAVKRNNSLRVPLNVACLEPNPMDLLLPGFGI
jgi:hypothetical protein